MSPVKIVFLGLQHPHIWSRLNWVQERSDTYELVGIFDENLEYTAKFYDRLKVKGVHNFGSIDELLGAGADVCFIHSLDHDVCRHALATLKYDSFKGIFLEKIGAANPQELYGTVKIIQEKRPDLVIEWGWEMHYSESMDFARDVLAKKALGEITSAHFHGGCPAGGALELWQLLETTLGGYVYTDGSHTLEQVVDLFGVPKRLVSSIRSLPEGKETFKAVTIITDLFDDPKSDSYPVKVGTLVTPGGKKREDIASVIMEYDTMNIAVDFTAWEAHNWCADWTTDIYGTNGTFHSFLSPPAGNVYIREPRGGYSKGENPLNGEKGERRHLAIKCFNRQMDTFFQRVALGNDEADKQGLDKCDIPRQVGIMKILEAMFKSAETGTFVEIDQQ